jgi:hypothetical protein
MRTIVAVALILLALASGGPADAQEDSGVVGATIFVDPLSATLRIRPETVQQTPKPEANARATIVNNGPATVINVTATLLIDPRITVIGGATRTVASIAGDSSSTVTWRLCGKVAGNYLALAIVTARDAQGRPFQTETTAAMLSVIARRGTSNC